MEGKQKHLRDEQQRGGGEEYPRIRAPEMGEGHHIVDARRQQHQQHAKPDHRVIGCQRQQDSDDCGDDDEVRREQYGEEAGLLERPTEFRQRHLEKGDEEHQRERGRDCRFPCRGAGHQRADSRPDGERGEIQPDLARLEPIAQCGNAHVHCAASGASKSLATYGAPDRIRTCGPQIRNLVLYPAELRAPPCGP